MDRMVTYLANNWPILVTPAAVLLGTLGVGFLARHWLFRTLHRWTSKTSSKVDDILLGALRGPFLLWILILAIHLAMQSSELPTRLVQPFNRILLILWVLSLTITASRLAVSVIRHYGRAIQGAMPVTSLTENLARVLIVILGGLILLNIFGVSITPLLTALGVGGLAVALALQDTLSNLFAGFYISIAGQVRVGDYVKLDSGEEGYVTDITWRSTTIRALPNNLIIVPNAKLAQAIVTNYCLPEKRMSLLIPIGVSYDSDPANVEKILVDEALQAAGSIPGLLAEPAPFVRFIPGFGDSSLNFTLIVQVQEFVDQFLVQHELRKKIFARFRREDIEIPFPIRTVHLRDGRAPTT